MTFKFLASAAIVGGLGLAAGFAHAADEQSMRLKRAPKDALAAAEAARPDVTFKKVDVEVEDGVTTYECSGETEDGREVEVDVAAEWSVLEIEEIIGAEDVPDAVMQVVDIQIPGFEPGEIERSVRPDGVVVYEFEGADADGVEVDLEVQADGESIVVLNDEEA